MWWSDSKSNTINQFCLQNIRSHFNKYFEILQWLHCSIHASFLILLSVLHGAGHLYQVQEDGPPHGHRPGEEEGRRLTTDLALTSITGFSLRPLCLPASWCRSSSAPWRRWWTPPLTGWAITTFSPTLRWASSAAFSAPPGPMGTFTYYSDQNSSISFSGSLVWCSG